MQDPIQNWRWSEEGQFEIWPINVQGQSIRFTGQRALDPLAAGTDTADLDDLMLVLFVAADILARSKQADAKLKLDAATLRLAQQRGGYPTKPKGLIIGNTGETDKLHSRLIPIAVAGR
jgi:hypothetical protein